MYHIICCPNVRALTIIFSLVKKIKRPEMFCRTNIVNFNIVNTHYNIKETKRFS